MKILLVCAAGMSTSMLVSNMKKCAAADVEIAAKPIAELSKVINDWDVVLVVNAIIKVSHFSRKR